MENIVGRDIFIISPNTGAEPILSRRLSFIFVSFIGSFLFLYTYHSAD